MPVRGWTARSRPTTWRSEPRGRRCRGARAASGRAAQQQGGIIKSTRDWRTILRGRWLAVLIASLAASAAWAPAYAATLLQGPPPPQADGAQAAAIDALARDAMAKYDLKAVILRVTIDGQEVVTEALGESMTGVPATTDMHFRNGAVAFTYMTTLLLQLVDQGVVRLDDTLAAWVPELPDADRVT